MAIPLTLHQVWLEEQPAMEWVLMNPLALNQAWTAELSQSWEACLSLEGGFQGLPSDLHNERLMQQYTLQEVLKQQYVHPEGMTQQCANPNQREATFPLPMV